MRAKAHSLEIQLVSFRSSWDAPGIEGVSSAGHPATLVDLGPWAMESIAPRIIILPRAVRAARKSVFADVPLVYRVLEAMRDLYWPMRFEGKSPKDWEGFLASEHLRCSHTGEGPISARDETYHVSWQGRRVPLDRHIVGSSSRDEAKQFRLYFHVSDVGSDRTIVVGSLPAHLPNRQT